MKGREGTWRRSVYERNREESRWSIQPDRFKVKAEGETHTHWDTTRQEGRRGGGWERRGLGKAAAALLATNHKRERWTVFSSSPRRSECMPRGCYHSWNEVGASKAYWTKVNHLQSGRRTMQQLVPCEHKTSARREGSCGKCHSWFATVALCLRCTYIWGEEQTHNPGYINSQLHQYMIAPAGFLCCLSSKHSPDPNPSLGLL